MGVKEGEKTYQFKVWRASDWDAVSQPIEGAERVEEEYETWTGETQTRMYWTIEFSSLDEVMEIVEEIDDVVIQNSRRVEPPWDYELIIYDGYIE